MSSIAEPLIAWHRLHGRMNLPWQRDRTPYRVWVSEIMLQQTQVATVVGYYGRFMEKFPDLQSLAAAPIDEVLHLWSGLGYYSRARNLKRAAERIVAEHGGELPGTLEALAALPGIGRSTAAAILSLARGQRAAILDGNVRRVLSRLFGIDGPPSAPATLRQLWSLAEANTPDSDNATYTQAIMDFGATLCTRHRPLCMHCPLQRQCVAFQSGRVAEMPAPRVKRTRPLRRLFMLLAVTPAGEILLRQRPPVGIWGGLWSPPDFATLEEAQSYSSNYLRRPAIESASMPPFRHGFTHFDLELTPIRVRCEGLEAAMEGPGVLWYNARQPARIGVPAPVATLLSQLGNAVP